LLDKEGAVQGLLDAIHGVAQFQEKDVDPEDVEERRI
jgi:hypothetical protein